MRPMEGRKVDKNLLEDLFARSFYPPTSARRTNRRLALTIWLSILTFLVILGILAVSAIFIYSILYQDQAGGSKVESNVRPEGKPKNVLSRNRRSPLTSSTSTFVEGRHDPTVFMRRFDAEQNLRSPVKQCQRRSLSMCRGVVPYNSTVYPNYIGDNNVGEAARSLPYFNYIAKSHCNRRIKQLLCSFLEPPCVNGHPVPPCKKFCRIALEGCAEYVPATLELSAAFDCRRYPDSTDPATCVNLAMGEACSADEYHCPDKSCIPRHWVCDGVRDCIFAADEADCAGVACSSEEFQCDRKCVPLSWKCDGDRDCLDGSDEANCPRVGCGPDRYKCRDGYGCIPKRWVCDGKAECRDGSDEWNCQSRKCTSNDFKCANGICIPRVWVCDGQDDCKDGSDEGRCSLEDFDRKEVPPPATNNLLNHQPPPPPPPQSPSPSPPRPGPMRRNQVGGGPQSRIATGHILRAHRPLRPNRMPVRHTIHSLEPYVSSNNIYRLFWRK